MLIYTIKESEMEYQMMHVRIQQGVSPNVVYLHKPLQTPVDSLKSGIFELDIQVIFKDTFL